jgi:hypothetical protein
MNILKKTKKSIVATVTATILLTSCLSAVSAEEQSLHEKMLHSRAIDAAVWAMPMMNFKQWRDGHMALGAGYNDVTYNSTVQDWKYQTATPNNTTPYIDFFWTLKDGPIVVEIPPSADGIGIFGTLMDVWQRPIDDIGARGRDKGNGGKYVMVPEGYQGPILPNAYTYHQRTTNGFAILRPIMDGGPTEENLKKAAEFAKTIKVYPLSMADNPPKNNYIDIYGKLMEGTPVFDETIFSEIHEIVQEEVIEEQNMAMMGLLKYIGIVKGQPFEPNDEQKKIYKAAGPDAHQFMLEEYHRHINPWMYEGKMWSVIIPPGVIETDFSYEYPTYFDYSSRGSAYYGVISSVKNYGDATFYIDVAESGSGVWLEGSQNYKLNVPPNVPVNDFWAVTVYDLLTASYLRDQDKSSVDSNMELAKNDDGSIDVYFGPKAPKGKEANWIPTTPDRRFFMLFRFYGPKAAAKDGSWQLNDIEKL